MNWNSLAEMLAMGGYWPYVWGSFGVVASMVAAEVLLVGQRWRRAARISDARRPPAERP